MRKVGDWYIGDLSEEGGSARGGNAEVFGATKDGKAHVALKLLHKSHNRAGSEPYERFRREVQALESLRGTRHVMPILDHHVPETPSASDPAYYVMPIMEPVQKAVADSAAQEIVAGIRDLAGMLASVREQHRFAHRDIKPDNIFVHQGEWVLGDWGLVKHPTMPALTAAGRKIGPVYYIAPEMLNPQVSSDGYAADVHSLAKTLWVLLTGQNYPLPGPYFTHPERLSRVYSVASYVGVDADRLKPLDWLLEHATDMDPSRRPSMSEFATELNAWLAPTRTEGEPSRDVTALAREIVAATRPAVQEIDSREERRRLSQELRATVQTKLRPLEEKVRALLPTFNVGLGSGEGAGANHLKRHAEYRYHQQVGISVQPRALHGTASATASIEIALGLSDDDMVFIEAGHYSLFRVEAENAEAVESRCLWDSHQEVRCGTPMMLETMDDLVLGLVSNLPLLMRELHRRVCMGGEDPPSLPG